MRKYIAKMAPKKPAKVSAQPPSLAPNIIVLAMRQGVGEGVLGGWGRDIGLVDCMYRLEQSVP